MIEKVKLESPKSIQSNPDSASLLYLFGNFLKIGSTAFGGFMALVSVIEDVIVGKRKLLTHEDMLDGISLASVLPGPVAVNVVAYVGYRLRGGIGALVTATAVLIPSFILVVCLTIAYLQAGEIPAVNRVFAGFIPAVAAIIINAAIRMSKKAIIGWREVSLAVVAAILLKTIGGFYITLIVILGAGVIGWICFRDKVVRSFRENPPPQETTPLEIRKIAIPLLILAVILLLSLLPLPLGEDSLAKLFVTFSGMSLMLFGGGYVFIPMIQEVVVNNYGWVTQTEFSNAIAMMITLSHLLDRIKYSVVIQAALKGIRPAVIGMIFTAAVVVGQTAQVHWASLVIFAASLAAIWKLRLEVVLIIPLAGLIGLFLY